MKLVYCTANIYLLVYISHFLPIISRRHLKHTADKCTCAWEFKKPFIFCFITLRYIQAKINEQILLLSTFKERKTKCCIYTSPRKDLTLLILMAIFSILGSCTDMLNAFACTCQSGFTGLRCEVNINDCPSSGCGNGEFVFNK